MQTLSVEEAKAKFAEILSGSAGGDSFLVASEGEKIVKVTLENVLPEPITLDGASGEAEKSKLSPHLRQLLHGQDTPPLIDIDTPYRREIEIMFCGEYGNSPAKLPSQKAIDRISQSMTDERREELTAKLIIRGMFSAVEDESLRVPDDFDTYMQAKIIAMFEGSD